jgi:acetyl-CoA C-acetyltransferase
VAQDAVDLGGAIILTSAGKARELGIDQSKWIWLAGAAEAAEPPLSERAIINRSAALDFAIPAALDQAELTSADLGPVDIYSCFPCAVFAAVDSMQDPSRPLGDYTLTGGLSFFGGPGNGYAVYNIAAMVEALRKDGAKPALVTANGGVMSKQAVGIYSATQPVVAWSGEVAKGYAPAPLTFDDAPDGRARVLSFVRPAGKDGFGPATVLIEMAIMQREQERTDAIPQSDCLHPSLTTRCCVRRSGQHACATYREAKRRVDEGIKRQSRWQAGKLHQ